MKKAILSGVVLAALMFNGLALHANGNQTEINGLATSIAAYEISTFCKAILKGDVETVKKLIELGEDVNKKSLGMTPAHFAARYNKPEILKVLIANGANLKAKCDKGYTVKKYAEMANADDAMAVLKNAMKK